jgi:predicted CopG family antitoxin
MRDISIEYDCQLKQLEKLKSEKESLKQNAERIAELYEERNDKSIEIQKRYFLYPKCFIG